MKKIITIVLSLFCSLLAFPQEGMLIKGRIVTDSLSGTSINIVNLTRETGTTNSAAGTFEIEAMENDTLIFSSVQFEIVRIKVTPEILNEGFLEVRLHKKMTRLEEVQISNISLTGNLERDISGIETFNQTELGFPMSSVKPPTPVERHLSTARGTPVVLLLNTLNGRIKMLEKAKKMESKAMLVTRGLERFPASYFTESLGIPEVDIKRFVYFCADGREFEEYLQEGRELELMQYYQEMAIIFLRRGGKKPPLLPEMEKES